MPAYQSLDVTEVGDVTVVCVRRQRISEKIDSEEFGSELCSLVENSRRQKLLLNLSTVEYLSSAAVGKLITLHRKVKAKDGVLKLSNIRPRIYEVFTIFKLDRLFDIQEEETDALAAF